MDKDLLKMAIELAKTQLLNNAIASASNPATQAPIVSQSAVTKLVMGYYEQLAKSNL